MKKIFTLGCGLLLMSALAVNEAKADYLPQSITIYIQDYDGNNIASSVKTELTKDEDGNYVIQDFLYSESPVKFTFEKPNADEWSGITFTGNIDNEYPGYPYLLDENGDYMDCAVENLEGVDQANVYKGWTWIYYPYVCEDGISSVYRYDESDEDDYDYYASICLRGTLTDESNSPYLYLKFWFNEPETAPTFPENFHVTTFNKGLEVTQGYEWGCYNINVKGKVASPTFSIVIDVPEGWDGFVCQNWSHEGDVTITESKKAGTRAEEIKWDSVEKLLADGYVKGNRFTLEPTYVPVDGNYQTIELHLYKGDFAIKEDMLDLMVYVSEGGELEGPEFPETFDVTATGNQVTVKQSSTSELPEGTLTETEYQLAVEMFKAENAIIVSGSSDSDSTTVEFNLPENWKGVQPFKINVPDLSDYEYYNTRANEPGWQMLDEVKESLNNMMGYFDTSMEGGKKLDFSIGEKQLYLCYLYADIDEGGENMTLADTANPFLLVVDVDHKDVGSAVESIDALDANANYYNVNGIKVTNPTKGIYIKVVDGKATKVAVK